MMHLMFQSKCSSCLYGIRPMYGSLCAWRSLNSAGGMQLAPLWDRRLECWHNRCCLTKPVIMCSAAVCPYQLNVPPHPPLPPSTAPPTSPPWHHIISEHLLYVPLSVCHSFRWHLLNCCGAILSTQQLELCVLCLTAKYFDAVCILLFNTMDLILFWSSDNGLIKCHPSPIKLRSL